MVWKFFHDHPTILTKSICNLCGKNVNKGDNSNTSNMRKHASKRHPIQWNNAELEEKQKKEADARAAREHTARSFIVNLGESQSSQSQVLGKRKQTTSTRKVSKKRKLSGSDSDSGSISTFFTSNP